jgi:hypothetical protein
VAALVSGPIAYACFQFTEVTKDRPDGLHHLHYLLQVLLSFGIVAAIMTILTLIKPLPEPKILPEKVEIPRKTEPVVYAAGALVILGVAVFFAIFW